MSSKIQVLFCIQHVDFLLKLVLTGVVQQLVFSFLTGGRKSLGLFIAFFLAFYLLGLNWARYLFLNQPLARYMRFLSVKSYHFLKLEGRGSAFPEAHGCCTGKELIPEQNQGFFFFFLRKRNELIYQMDLIIPVPSWGERGKKFFLRYMENIKWWQQRMQMVM